VTALAKLGMTMGSLFVDKGWNLAKTLGIAGNKNIWDNFLKMDVT